MQLKLVIYADAAHENLANGASQESYLIFVVAKNLTSILLNWQLKRIQKVVRSSLAAETLALSHVVDSGVYLKNVLSELLFNNTNCIRTEIVSDIKFLYDTLLSKKNVLEKCLWIDIALLKEFIDNKSFTKIHYAPSQNQSANVLAKKREHHQRNFSIHFPKELFHFNRIFTILGSVTIVALKLIYFQIFLCIGLWHFNTSISLKYNRVFRLWIIIIGTVVFV